MLRALIVQTRTILGAVLAIGGASLVVNATEPSGDPRLAIADVERKISAIDRVVKRHTYEVRDATTRAPSDASRSIYRMTGQRGEVFYFEGPADPSGIDINQVAVELFLKKNRKFVAYDSAWTEVQAIWSGLSRANQRIARAKALRHFESKPGGVSSEEWEDRIRQSESQWHIR
jgi:hypothetical protein